MQRKLLSALYEDAATNYSGVTGVGRDGEVIEDKPGGECGWVYTDGVLYPDSSVSIRDITDGLSHTLAVGERVYFIDAWWQGGSWSKRFNPRSYRRICSHASKNIRAPLNARHDQFPCWRHDQECHPDEEKTLCRNELYFGSEHPGGAQFLFADGSVHFLNDSLELATYHGLATRRGGELEESATPPPAPAQRACD